MVKVKFVGRAAHNTFAAVPLPNLKLDVSWHNSAANGVRRHRNAEILLAFYSSELEFKNCAMRGGLTP